MERRKSNRRYLNGPSLFKKAAKLIYEFNPEAKIIIMLRNPVEVMYSLYHQYLFNGNEDLPTFEQALAAEPQRKQGLNLPKGVIVPEGLYYRDFVQFLSTDSTLFKYFP